MMNLLAGQKQRRRLGESLVDTAGEDEGGGTEGVAFTCLHLHV